MELKKYKLGEILDVTRGANLSGEFYATEGEYIRLTCGNFDYQNNLVVTLTIRIIASKRISPKIISIIQVTFGLSS